MKTILHFSLLILLSIQIQANTIFTNTISLGKNFKIENTFSGNFEDKTSFHLIFSKDKANKNYAVHSYLYDGENIINFDKISNSKAYNLVSFHKNGTVLSLLLGYKVKKDAFIQHITINTATKEIKKAKALKNEDVFTNIRQKNRSIIIYKTDDNLSFVSYGKSLEPETNSYNLKDFDSDLNSFFDEDGAEAVKTDEFVANGSVASFKVYNEGDHLIFTKDDSKNNLTRVIDFNYKNDNLKEVKIHKITNDDKNIKYKKLSTYYQNGKLFQFSNNKKVGNIKITDIKNDKSNTINLAKLNSKQLKTGSDFQNIEKFLKNSGKNAYKTTITANTTRDKNVKVRVDYVDINYGYHYNWWWHHHQFMMWQQQMMHHQIQQIRQSVPSGFGPSAPVDYDPTVYLKSEKRYFEFTINIDNTIIDDNSETTYKEIDKKKYIDKLEDVKGIKHKSSCFLDESFRYIAYSKKLKGFIFQTNKI